MGYLSELWNDDALLNSDEWDICRKSGRVLLRTLESDGELFPCPCCGLRTLTETFNPSEGTGYDICPFCNWEDDGTTDIKKYRSINKGSIEDYRKKILKKYNSIGKKFRFHDH